jgi:deoxyribodipyrimidine photo-lyase
LNFTTEYEEIRAKINAIEPIKYGQSRNYVDGAVTYLSPYISRGVISTKQVLQNVLSRGYKISQIESFVKELCWRDYFQRVGQRKNLNLEIKQAQEFVAHRALPKAVLEAKTGIEGIDTAIEKLYQTGYMHNHCRMYTASLVCNLAKAHWLLPAQWMYYHLLDGDWASNACSWQWVAGANSSKKYYANQENINKYTHTNQSGTFLDMGYEAIAKAPIPAPLQENTSPVFKTELPVSDTIQIDSNLPTLIYNYYNLDPLWHRDINANRILLLEPAFFDKYPVNSKCIEFAIQLGKNIKNLQVYVGSFASLCSAFALQNVVYKEHPLNEGYVGIEEPRDWICESVSGYFPSFFAYWKKVEKELVKTTQIPNLMLFEDEKRKGQKGK